MCVNITPVEPHNVRSALARGFFLSDLCILRHSCCTKEGTTTWRRGFDTHTHTHTHTWRQRHPQDSRETFSLTNECAAERKLVDKFPFCPTSVTGPRKTKAVAWLKITSPVQQLSVAQPRTLASLLHNRWWKVTAVFMRSWRRIEMIADVYLQWD